MGLKLIQDHFPEGSTPIRTALVTARNAPAHKRVVNTLRAWGVRIDETFFLGGIDKGPVLEVLRPHIYFDDQMAHLETARRRTPSAQVIPFGAIVPDAVSAALPATPSAVPLAAEAALADAKNKARNRRTTVAGSEAPDAKSGESDVRIANPSQPA